MSVRIIVDSASDLTKERADALNLDYMPLKTIFGETEYLDGVTISHKEFYENWSNVEQSRRPARYLHMILKRNSKK